MREVFGFDSRAGQIGYNVVKVSPTLFLRSFVAKRENGPATRYAILRHATKIMKISFFYKLNAKNSDT